MGPRRPEISREIREFQQVIRSELGEGGDGSRAREYLSGLPRGKQLEAARTIAKDEDVRIRTFGVALLIEAGHMDETVPALATLVAQGQDLTPIGYYLVHSDSGSTALRMYLDTSRYLLAHLDDYGAEEREHVERFLCDGGYVNPIKQFSRSAVEERLREIERRTR